MRYFTAALGLLAFMLGSCNKGASPTYNDRPVVTAYLCAGTHPLVTISRQAATQSDIVFTDENLDSLKLELSDGINTYALMSADSGRYSDTSLVIAAGKTYTLRFEYNSKTVTATTTVPAAPLDYAQSATSIGLDKIDSTFTPGPGGPGFTMPDPVDLSWTNSDNSYYLVVAQNLEENPELVRDTLSSGFARPSFGFRNEPATVSATRINSQQFEYFGKYRLVLYRLQADYAALYESVSNSSTSLTTASSNVTNGFGIFTGMSADTLFLQVNKN